MLSRKNYQDSMKSNQFKNFSEKSFRNHSKIHIQHFQQQLSISKIFCLFCFGDFRRRAWSLSAKPQSPASHSRAHRALYQNNNKIESRNGCFPTFVDLLCLMKLERCQPVVSKLQVEFKLLIFCNIFGRKRLIP